MMNDVEKEETYLGFPLKKKQRIHLPGLFANTFIMELHSLLQNSPVMCQASCVWY